MGERKESPLPERNTGLHEAACWWLCEVMEEKLSQKVVSLAKGQGPAWRGSCCPAVDRVSAWASNEQPTATH